MKKSPQPIVSLILTIRSLKLILDSDLAELYGVATKVFNQAVKRNLVRFPQDFMFQLTPAEWVNLKSQVVTASAKSSTDQQVATDWSQSVTSSIKNRGAFTPRIAFIQ